MLRRVTRLAVQGGSRHDVIDNLLAVPGMIPCSGAFGHLTLSRRDGHRIAKQALIEIERALGLA